MGCGTAAHGPGGEMPSTGCKASAENEKNPGEKAFCQGPFYLFHQNEFSFIGSIEFAVKKNVIMKKSLLKNKSEGSRTAIE